jgi:hypothetical protein
MSGLFFANSEVVKLNQMRSAHERFGSVDSTASTKA